jgi:hypothetical protein
MKSRDGSDDQHSGRSAPRGHQLMSACLCGTANATVAGGSGRRPPTTSFNAAGVIRPLGAEGGLLSLSIPFS